MSEKEEFISKLKTMSLEDLKKYDGAAKFIQHIVSMLAIFSILFTLYFPTLLVMLPVTLLIILFANISSGVGEFRKELKMWIDKKINSRCNIHIPLPRSVHLPILLPLMQKFSRL